MKTLLLLLLLFGISSAHAQTHRLRIMEYNVENLFDTVHAPQKFDNEFTPNGAKKWSSRRYWTKLGKVSRVIAAVGEIAPVDLVALIEIENDSVIHHLTQRTKLWRLGYDYIVSHSNDVRGVNVALLYQPHKFRPIHHDTLRIHPEDKALRPSRDILHVAGVLTTGDTLDVMICHLPSRRGGKPAERYRLQHTQALRNLTDSLMQRRHHPHLVLTGDFNAFYPEKCLTQGLQVQLPTDKGINSDTLYLLTYKLKASHDIEGTYKFQGEWNQLDHFIVNGRLLQPHTLNNTIITDTPHCRLVDFPWLLQTDKNGYGVHPHRSFLGPYYSGGYSDHLPILLDLFY